MNDEKPVITEEQYKIAEKNGISKKNVNNRVFGLVEPWSVERAITEPVKSRKGKYAEHLKTAHSNGISTEAFHSRRRMGWSLKDAATRPIQKNSGEK